MKDRRPLAVMLSKRANVFYLEHVRVMQKDARVVYLTQTRSNVEQIVNIPDKNLAFLLLGKGTSITDAAMRMLAESNVIVGFSGSGGSPIHGLADPIFISPMDEYRPTEYMQRWVKMWFDEDLRLKVAKLFLNKRIELNSAMYKKIAGWDIPEDIQSEFRSNIAAAPDTVHLLTSEAHYAKELYKLHAQHSGLKFVRDPGAGKRSKGPELANSYLDHGNYIAYGFAAASLHVLGISFAFPVLHGKTRRGALVFDVADLAKDWLIMPAAFRCGSRGEPDNVFRASVIDCAMKNEVLDVFITFIKEACESVS